MNKTKSKDPWTQFMDMNSGGGKKLKYKYIYIQAPKNEAEIIFQNKFGRNPNRVTCTCCGPDYSISESEDLRQATAFNRGCKWDNKKEKYIEEEDSNKFSWQKFMSLDNYLKEKDVCFIFSEEIKPSWRKGELHEEGYVWR